MTQKCCQMSRRAITGVSLQANHTSAEVLLYLSPHQALWNGLSPSILWSHFGWQLLSVTILPHWSATRLLLHPSEMLLTPEKTGHKHHSYTFSVNVSYSFKNSLKATKNHRRVWFQRAHLLATLCHGRDTLHQTRLLRAPSKLVFNTPRDGASTSRQFWAICASASPSSRGKRFFPQEQVNCDTSSTFPVGPNTPRGYQGAQPRCTSNLRIDSVGKGP